jgi:hypothetical protein
MHQGDVPSLDPRTWKENVGPRTEDRGPRTEDRGPRTGDKGPRTSDEGPGTRAVCVALDILDEDHSLRLALRRLASDADLRATLGRAAQAWWQREHSPDAMVEDYMRLIEEAVSAPAPAVELPSHLRTDGDTTLRSLVTPLGLGDALSRDGLLE